MMTVNECISYVEKHLTVKYATSNGAYKTNQVITPKGCVNHSIGVAQPSVDVMYDIMNKSSATWGVNAILGDFHKGEGRIIQTLKLNTRPWGCGAGSKGSWNDSKIQWEVCEPAGHTYSGGTMIGYDVAKNKEYFNRMWKMLVAWNVYCIKKYGYSVSEINDHSESHKKGYGSNHADIMQWLPKHGKSMDALRSEVKAILDSEKKQQTTNKTTATKKPESTTSTKVKPFLVKVSVSDLRIRKGPGTNYAATGLHTGKGIFTIVDVKTGTGSKAGWGLLKSYEKNRNGWISLDYASTL